MIIMGKYTLSTSTYAELNEAFYNKKERGFNLNANNKPLSLLSVPNGNGGHTQFFVHMKSAPNQHDYQAVLVEKAGPNMTHTGEFVIINRGSESWKDWTGNFQALLKNEHPQTALVKEFAKEAQGKIEWVKQKYNIKEHSITNTGHSLGGFEAHIGHLVNHGKVVAFNALNPAFSNEWKHNLIENHIMALDIASSAHKDKMPGTIHTYVTENDNRILNANGYGNFMPNRPILLVSDDVAFNHLSHSNSYFAGEHSVLRDPQAKVRANELKEKINEWRRG